MKRVPSRATRLAALRIVAVYAVIAALWIYLSDHVMGLMVSDPALLVRIGVLKGFLFIVVTGAILYELITRYILKAVRIAEELREHRDLVNGLIEGTSDAIYVKDRQGRYLLFNAAAADFTGKAVTEVLGNDDTALFSTTEAAAVMAGDRLVMESGRVMTYEEHVTTADGAHRTFLSTKGPLFTAAGGVGGLYGIARDITERRQAAEQLRKSEEQLRLAIESARLGTWDHDLLTGEHVWSDRCKAMFGLPTDAQVSKETLFERLHPDDQQRIRAAVRQALDPAGTGEFIAEYRSLWPDGTVRWIFSRGRASFGTVDGLLTATRFVGTVYDVTGQMKAEAALVQSEADWRSLFENMLAGCAYCRMIFEDGRPQDFVYLRVNRAFEEMTGLQEVVGKRITELVPGIHASNPELLEIYGRVAQTGQPERFETWVEQLGIWFSVAVHSTERGSFVAVFENITARKRAEDAREATVELLRLCNGAAGVRELMRELISYFQRYTECEAIGVRLRDGDDFPYYETRGFAENFLAVEGSLCTRGQDGELLRDDTGHPVLVCMCGAVIDGRCDLTQPFFSPRGSFWSSCTAELPAGLKETGRQGGARNRCIGEGYESLALIPLSAHGQVFGLFQFNDRRRGRFTPEKIALLEELVDYVAIALAKLRSDEELTESNRFSQQVVSSVGEGVIVLGPDLCYRVWNPFMERLSGLSDREVLGRHPLELFPALRDTGGMSRLETALSGRVPPTVDQPYYFPNSGRSGWFADACSPLRNSKGEVSGVICTLRDITEDRRAQEALLEEKSFTENALNNIGELFFVFDQDGKFLRWNKAITELSGYSDEEIAMMKPADFFSEAERPRVMHAIMSAFRGGNVMFEALVTSKDGGEFPYEFTGSPLKDRAGKVIGISGTGRDISERKRAELKREELEAQLRQAQKIEAVGRLAGGVAHDFNNMLSVILGYADVILAQLDPQSPFYGYLRQIQAAGQRSADLTRQLLAFSRKQVIAPVAVNLNVAIPEQQKMLGRLIGEEISIEFFPATDLWNIRIDPSQIDQILANLAVNARDAIAGVGTVTIMTANTVVNEEESRELHLKPGDHVLLSFRDSGCGMDARTCERIFEPFFTTKGEGKGTGLGLATVYGIVKQNEGAIHVESEPGKGATFKIYFRRFLADVVELNEPPGEVWARGSETVLVVEDEANILELSRTILEAYGYRVMAVSSPEDACRICAEFDGTVHLLLSDVVMPAMNGKELKERIEAIKPGIRTLFMSGYTSDIIAHRGVIDQGINFIRKPFTLRSLVENVRAVLDAPAEAHADGRARGFTDTPTGL